MASLTLAQSFFRRQLLNRWPADSVPDRLTIKADAFVASTATLRFRLESVYSKVRVYKNAAESDCRGNITPISVFTPKLLEVPACFELMIC